MPKPEQMNEFILQIAYDLAQEKKTGKPGPEGQKFFDFIDAAGTLGSQALENEKKRGQDVGQHNYEKRPREERSETRGQLLERMGSYASTIFKLEKLGDILHSGNYKQAEKLLPKIASEINDFAADYEKYKKAMPDLIPNDPVLMKFDQLWSEQEHFPKGKEFLDKINGVEVGQADQEPEKEAQPKSLDDDLPPLNINDEIIETQRKNFQLNKGRSYRDRFSPVNQSYDGILGKCRADADNKDARIGLLARALAAAQLRREGAPFEKKALNDRAKEIAESPGFPSMTRNEDFVLDSLQAPDKIDRVLETYEQENKLARRAPAGPKSYDEYFRRHTWPNVPKGQEKAYLAKCISANRLQSNGTPFDLETVRKDAEEIQKQPSFRKLTTEDTGHEEADARVRRWLHRDEIVTADLTLRDHRSRELKKNMVEKDRTQKSWAGYRRMHTGENVPANAGADAKRLYLAKAMVAVRGMADGKPFDLKNARKAAAALVKNPYFKAMTRDPAKVSEVLASGKVVGMFDEMANARRRALLAKQKPAEPSLERQPGLEAQGKKPASNEAEPQLRH